MKHLFVPYHIALALKEKGFNEPCFSCYWEDKSLHYFLYDTPDNLRNNSHQVKIADKIGQHLITAPLYQQVIDWFREKHNVDIYTSPDEGIYVKGNKSYGYTGTGEQAGFPIYKSGFDLPIEALTEAIEEALKLIP